ncbi:MAG: peptidoglycan DD-metalloendopeptidase family protein [Gaiellaceae bacterium]
MTQRERWGGVLLTAGLLALLVVAGAGARPLLAVTIATAPSDPSTSTEATFVFSADARGAAFTCSLDAARATTCRSPLTYRGLALGRHTFVVTAARGRERATARHSWTIVPPPPPDEPEPGWLTVMVEGSGAVESAPAGISCPPACSSTFAPGSSVLLTADGQAGARLGQWAGACAGRGSSCTVTVRASTFVKAAFVPARTPPDARRVDRDRDRVPDVRDECPETARGVRTLVYGCSVLDLMRNAQHLLGRLGLYDGRAGDARRIRGIAPFRAVHRSLVRNLARIRTGAQRAERGDLCGAAAIVRTGASAMRAAARDSAKRVSRMQVALERSPDVDDASEKDLQHAGLRYRQRLVERAGTEADHVRKAFDGACARLGKRQVFQGRVARIDAAAGLLRLAGGRLFALPPGGFSGKGLAEGAGARLVVREMKGGAPVVTSAVGLDFATVAASSPPCVSLRFAPPQDWLAPNPVVHSTLGYLASGVYWLEEGVRFATTPECPAGQHARYSLRVVFSAPGEPTKTISDLTSDDGVVGGIPISGSSKTWTITVTERRQGNSCPPPGDQPQPFRLPPRSGSGGAGAYSARRPHSIAKSFPCPVVDVRTTTYPAKFLPPGAYATALYDETILAVNENGFDTTKVFVVGKHPTAFGATFEADGYGTTGADPPFAFKTIHLNEPFGVRPDDWYSIYPYATTPGFILYDIGVDHFAGLVWPRIVGTRNGSPFRYRAKLPELVKDLLPGCAGETCFYRLPWKAGDSEKTTQGNNQPASHNGTQAYAFDFVHEDGEGIYATRGGIVGDVVESLSANCVRPADCPANYVRIDHQDDTYSWYAHVRKNSVLPVVGQKVLRGQKIATVGNVGRSDRPHLHYQVSADKTNTIYGQTTNICFEVIWFNVETGDPVVDPCYVPLTGYFHQSTNG